MRKNLGTFAVVLGCASFLLHPTQLAVRCYPDLPPGSQYQLVFVTSDATTAESTNIADYNSFVRQEAAQNSSLPAATWNVVASTATVNAVNNALTYSSIPIYNTHGQLVASGSSGFGIPRIPPPSTTMNTDSVSPLQLSGLDRILTAQ